MFKLKIFITIILFFSSYLVATNQDEKSVLIPINLFVHADKFTLKLGYQIVSSNQYDKKTLVDIKLGTIALVKNKTKEFLQSTKGKNQLKKELISMINSNIYTPNISTIYYSKFILTSQDISHVVVKKKNLLSPKIDKRVLALKKYKSSYSFLVKNKEIDINSRNYRDALLDAEEATKLDSLKSKYWINYAMLLLPLQNVQEAQISAEIAAKIAYRLDNTSSREVNMILLQSYINQFDFIKASIVINELIDEEPILINNLYISNAFVSTYAFSGELEQGINYLASLLSKYPSYYGAMVAEIKLHKLEGTVDNIDDLRDNLRFIYKKYRKKLSLDMRREIKTLLEDF